MTRIHLQLLFISVVLLEISASKVNFYDICERPTGRRLYLEYKETGKIVANYSLNEFAKETSRGGSKKCTIEFLTCPSCIVEIKFSFLNISKNCGSSSVFNNYCGCEFVWIYEPPFEEASGEQFCGRFIQNNNASDGLFYSSKTRSVAITFTYNKKYNVAFALDYISERNRVILNGWPKIGKMNNATQIISSPYFPYNYPIDLSVEYVIHCRGVTIENHCRINIVFTDFQLAPASIIEFFDWNGQRMYVTSGTNFRPPVISTTGPTLVMRFYANGATGPGYKAYYSFVSSLDSFQNIDINCGGPVGNLGGAITMMNMVQEGAKFYDCVWLVKPTAGFLHLKTHLYVKVARFSGFTGQAELTIKQGLTSYEPSVELLRSPHKNKEHVVPISQGFYVSFRGFFNPNSELAIIYAAFNYKDCFAGSDFLCHNLRCISVLLSCDGFDHCGDSSDETANCSDGLRKFSRVHPQWNRVPNFLFPKTDQYASDLTAATLIFLTCAFGLIGIIFVMALLLYRVNVRSRHQRQIQDHMETIHAILGELEEEIIIPDEPPDYEPPPDYADVVKEKQPRINPGEVQSCSATPSTSRRKIPKSPPPIYQSHQGSLKKNAAESSINLNLFLYRWKCTVLKKSSSDLKLVSSSMEHLPRYFSDSNLRDLSKLLAIDSCWVKTKISFRRSRSSDDVTHLL